MRAIRGVKQPKGVRLGGRAKGTPNKINSDLKGMIVGALNAGGGQEWLEGQMIANPVAFMSLIGRVLPTTMAGDKDNPLFPTRIELKLVHA